MGVSSSTFAAWIGHSRIADSTEGRSAPARARGDDFPGRSSRASDRDDDFPGRARGASVRAQTAVVRALADALKHHTARGDAAESLREQLIEELARLGLRPSRKAMDDY